MSQKSCPSCKSDRCGNHAACARKTAESREKNTQLILGQIKSIADELGRKRGRPLADWEVLKLTENFMDELDRKLRSDGVIK